MANRREKLDKSDPFARRKRPAPSGPVPDLNTLTNAMLRPDAAPATEPTEQTIDIFEISPDPAQPRRAIPSLVRGDWSGEPAGLGDVFSRWIQAYAVETGTDFDSSQRTLIHAIEGKETQRTGEQTGDPGPVESTLFRLVDLAASIYREGLINPITVARDATAPGRFLIETGERRWLAHHLLYSIFGDQFRRIRAQISDGINVWKQAYENNARDNLNAIGKARQFATLLMDLHAREGADFDAYEAFEREQDYYAQIADSKRFDIPRGHAETVITAMGVTNRSVTTRYRNLLKLPPPIWTVADDLDWTERRLRQLTALSKKEALTVAAQWVHADGITGYESLLPVGNTAQKSEAKASPADELHLTLEQSKDRIAKRLKKVNRRQAQALIEAYEAWLQDLKENL